MIITYLEVSGEKKEGGMVEYVKNNFNCFYITSIV